MKEELQLMKGNEAVAEGAIRAGADGFFGYPITPQSEVIEYLAAQKPHERTGMVLLQAESELAAINMLYGGGGAGKKIISTSSSPGISLMQEGISYIAGAELPCLLVNVVRGGPGLGTIQPSQSDYSQSTKGGGHGDYKLITLAPSSVQEMYDFVKVGFDLAFRYRNPVIIQSDGAIGQMMEKVELDEHVPRISEEEIRKKYPWATLGKTPDRDHNVITSLELDPAKQEELNQKIQAKYRELEEKDVRYEEIQCEDAEYLIVAYGTSSRIALKAIDQARSEGMKVGMLRPITLYPFPYKRIRELTGQVKGILSVEMSAGQMIEDVKLAVEGKVPAEHFGRLGGIIPSAKEIIEQIQNNFKRD